LTRLRPRRVTNAALYALRRALARRMVVRADARVAGSAFVIDSLRALGILGDAPVSLLPYGVPLADEARTSPPGSSSRSVPRPEPPALPLRLGFIGSVLPHKGLHVAAAACRALPPRSVTLEVWGDSSFAPDYTARVRELAGAATLRFHGRFDEHDRRAVLESLDLLVVPSLGLESFGLVAWEAIHAGVPVVCSDRLPLAEAVREGGFGAVYEAPSSDELARILAGVVADPSIVASWRARLPVVKAWSTHAAEIERVYDQVVAAAR
jgi:glycosyltransferase involved in cell wall biosynthesis